MVPASWSCMWISNEAYSLRYSGCCLGAENVDCAEHTGAEADSVPSSSRKRIVSQWSERIVGPIGRLFSRTVEKALEILIFAVSWQSLQGCSRLASAPADYSRRACFGSRENSWPVRLADYSRGLADYSRDRPTILAEGTGRLFSRTRI